MVRKVFLLLLSVLLLSSFGIVFSSLTNMRGRKPVHCIYNLRQIDGAKAQWALEKQKKTGDDADLSEVARYSKGGKLPICPKGGKYHIGKVGELVTCTIAGHTIN